MNEETKKTLSPSETLRVGVIGINGRGGVTRNLLGRDDVKIVALCDNRPAAYDTWKEWAPNEFGNMSFDEDYRRLLDRKDVDAVFVTTPDYCHEEMAVAALEAGKTVYCEKPLAITIEGCDRILETAMRTGSKLFVGHNMRYMNFVLQMKELIDAGEIGEVQCAWCRHFIDYGGDAYFKDWHSEQKNTTGLLLQKGAHDIDILHWLCGGYTTRVVGMGRLSVYNRCTDRRTPADIPNASFNQLNWPPLSQKKISPIVDVEDSSTIMMQLDNGVQANYMQCHYTPDECRNYTIIGDAGRVENIGYDKIALYNFRLGNHFGTPDKMLRVPPVGGSHGGADPQIIAAFVDFAKGAKIERNNPVAARNSVAAGVAGSYSIRNGNIPMDIPALPAELIEYFARGQEKRA